MGEHQDRGSLQCGTSVLLMTALGHLQTLGSRLNRVRFTPETGHWLTGLGTSVKCQDRTHVLRQTNISAARYLRPG